VSPVAFSLEALEIPSPTGRERAINRIDELRLIRANGRVVVRGHIAAVQIVFSKLHGAHFDQFPAADDQMGHAEYLAYMAAVLRMDLPEGLQLTLEKTETATVLERREVCLRHRVSVAPEPDSAVAPLEAEAVAASPWFPVRHPSSWRLHRMRDEAAPVSGASWRDARVRDSETYRPPGARHALGWRSLGAAQAYADGLNQTKPSIKGSQMHHARTCACGKVMRGNVGWASHRKSCLTVNELPGQQSEHASPSQHLSHSFEE